MDWIETTGRTIEEAKEAALDELGVDEADAEFEVLAEAKSGLFGRLRSEARVRARVRPTAPRPKEERRRRRPSSSSADAPAGAADAPAPAASSDARRQPSSEASTAIEEAAAEAVAERQDETLPAPARARRGAGARSRTSDDRNQETTVANETVDLAAQAGAAEEFVSGLMEAFGLQADVRTTVNDEQEVVDVAVDGEGLGLLIGPKGATLLAIQDLTRAAVQQKTKAAHGRVHVDVSSYRQKRSEALARFAVQVAEQVRSSGTRKALEPMSAPDRKVIHDALTDVEGVSTVSEGEDAARRVVILPA